jgi:hypothetical protein
MAGTSPTRPSGMRAAQSPTFKVATSCYTAWGGVGSLSCASATIPMELDMCKTCSSTVRTVAIAKFSELYVLGAEPYRGLPNCRTAENLQPRAR